MIARIQTDLLAFFDASARNLPWRATRDPYAVWISEVMLQQTRVEAVIPYYDRWLERFPDVATLADAPLDAVLKQWEGLGYYSRARHVHAAARVIREQHAGALPDSYTALRALPGVGDYTAGAVASIAFDAREPAVDGNVRRVLCRLRDAPRVAPKSLRALAASLVPADRPGDFNQALMELGARVCIPGVPRCGVCPLRTHCRAHAAGTQQLRPQRAQRKQTPVVDIATLVLCDDRRRLLITRRGERGLLARMWNFPGAEIPAGSNARTTAAALLSRLCAARVPELHDLGIVEHAFSHRRERYHCLLAHVGAAPPIAGEHAWIGEDTAEHALPRAQQRIRVKSADLLLPLHYGGSEQKTATKHHAGEACPGVCAAHSAARRSQSTP